MDKGKQTPFQEVMYIWKNIADQKVLEYKSIKSELNTYYEKSIDPRTRKLKYS